MMKCRASGAAATLCTPRDRLGQAERPGVLKVSIPGCVELEKTDDQCFRAVAKMKVGPVSARFKGKVTVNDLDPPNSSGEGEGGVAGFAKGGAKVDLAERDGGTLLIYAEAQISGNLNRDLRSGHRLTMLLR
jgi:uncharacterized protein